MSSDEFYGYLKLENSMKTRPLDIFKTVQKYYEKFYIRLDLLIKPAHLLFSQLVALIPSRSIRQMLVIFSGTLYCMEIQEKKESHFLVFTSSKKVK